ncbi:hypothetical protein PRIPAC_87564 [Pristionchus pacificus]|uniref:Uncharacterized protein n=1 Tax=Pristionchus pacificus TaxID=54126 RepID=A0A2A6CYD3_PRIPA|nr:hypothetical protein PRIPAC_87564 [Pristionchus pacificus]|eukprot:PDM83041.1 hypothetical protein PRIPAC_37434 [Pristionchus pacificus]
MTDSDALNDLFHQQCAVNHENSITDSPPDISPRWNALSIEHLYHRKHLPVISSFSFDNKVITRWTVDTRQWNYRMCISDRYLDYFGVHESKSNKIVLNYAANRIAEVRMRDYIRVAGSGALSFENALLKIMHQFNAIGAA